MMEELKYILEDINCDDLRKIASKLKLERYGRKQELIDRIMAFYDKPNFVPNLYKELNSYEKEYIDTIVKQRYNPLEKSINEVHKKYKLSGERLEKTNCFFIQNRVPKFIREELDKLVPPFEITYHKTNDKIDFLKFYNTIEIEDKSVIYFDEFIKYINENKVKVTNKKRDLSKKDCLKFIDNFQIKEVSKRIDEELHNIKDVDDTVIMKGVTDLLLSAHIINNDKDIFTLGSNYKKYIKLNKVQKIKLLLDSYIETNNINEINRMRSGIYRYDFTNFTDIRDFLLEAILKLPINEWVNMEDFLEQIRMKDGNFIRRCLGNVLKNDDYYNWYYPCGYDEFDYPLIDVCLMNYFAVLGIVDVVISNTCDDRGYREYLTNSYVKLTNFGAVVLGLTKETDELIINNIPLEIENNKIIICDDSASMEHELFFDRFLEKTKIDGNIIYELNFKGIAKAIDLGITLDEIYNYLEDNTLELPIEIINDFNYYKKMLNKVKIRKVTILEYPKNLKEEIKNIKVISNNTEDTEEIIVVNNKKIKDIKASLEKKKIFCHILEK